MSGFGECVLKYTGTKFSCQCPGVTLELNDNKPASFISHQTPVKETFSDGGERLTWRDPQVMVQLETRGPLHMFYIRSNNDDHTMISGNATPGSWFGGNWKFSLLYHRCAADLRFIH